MSLENIKTLVNFALNQRGLAGFSDVTKESFPIKLWNMVTVETSHSQDNLIFKFDVYWQSIPAFPEDIHTVCRRNTNNYSSYVYTEYSRSFDVSVGCSLSLDQGKSLILEFVKFYKSFEDLLISESFERSAEVTAAQVKNMGLKEAESFFEEIFVKPSSEEKIFSNVTDPGHQLKPIERILHTHNLIWRKYSGLSKFEWTNPDAGGSEFENDLDYWKKYFHFLKFVNVDKVKDGFYKRAR